ncbi:hypothetical protein Gohar_003780, partial [Gossypium harknessii]|nr:hypothetical protein [Gossypium harknessii]
VLHVLRDCPTARSIWDKIVSDEIFSSFYIGSLQEWITSNLQMHQTISLVGIDWSCLFKIIFWLIWKNLRQEEGFIAVGGLVQDQNSRWIMGFGRYLGNYTVTEAELWGIMDDLKLILDRRFERILIQIGSLELNSS